MSLSAEEQRNLRDLARHIETPLLFAHIRASSGSPIQQTNCHPFRYGRWLWMHNGVIRDFHEVKRDLVLAIDPDLYPSIEGSTDSEAFFYLVHDGRPRQGHASLARSSRSVRRGRCPRVERNGRSSP